MATLLDTSWIVMAGSGLACALVGWTVRHFWSRVAERAAERRISVLCDQLDTQDRKLQDLRLELQAEKARAFELQAALDVRSHPSAPALMRTRIQRSHGACSARCERGVDSDSVWSQQ